MKTKNVNNSIKFEVYMPDAKTFMVKIEGLGEFEVYTDTVPYLYPDADLRSQYFTKHADLNDSLNFPITFVRFYNRNPLYKHSGVSYDKDLSVDATFVRGQWYFKWEGFRSDQFSVWNQLTPSAREKLNNTYNETLLTIIEVFGDTLLQQNKDRVLFSLKEVLNHVKTNVAKLEKVISQHENKG